MSLSGNRLARETRGTFCRASSRRDEECPSLCPRCEKGAREDLLAPEKFTMQQRRESIDQHMVRLVSVQFVCEKSFELIELKGTTIFAMKDLERISGDPSKRMDSTCLTGTTL